MKRRENLNSCPEHRSWETMLKNPCRLARWHGLFLFENYY
jgi:hypothetical protein